MAFIYQFRRSVVVFGAAAATTIPHALSAQPKAPRPKEVPAAISLIKEADLKRDLYAMAGDAMRGREAGTPDEMRASMWVAEQLRIIGVKPVGDDGSYFQWFNMVRTRVSSVSTRGTLAGEPLEVWKEFIPLGGSGADVAGPVVWVRTVPIQPSTFAERWWLPRS